MFVASIKDDMQRADTANFFRAFKQAPWRTQTQAVAAWSMTLLIAAVVGGLYLAVAARAGTAGRDLQALEARKAELTRTNDELRARLAGLRSVTRLADRARVLGFQPAQSEQIEYLAVPNYPPLTQGGTAPGAATALPQETPSQMAITSLSEWLARTLLSLIPRAEGGG